MNGTRSPDAIPTSVSSTEHDEIVVNRSPVRTTRKAPSASVRKEESAEVTNAGRPPVDEAESEAETLITSPVKKREAAKQNAENGSIKDEPELADGQPVEDNEADAPGSPEDDNDLTSRQDQPKVDGEVMDVDQDSSDALSDVSVEESPSSSRASSQSRAGPELPTISRPSSNPRKRKHRASSDSLPSKRQSIEGSRRQLRGTLNGDSRADDDRSDSPRNRSHRRAASTQSFPDTSVEPGSRKRRAPPSTRSAQWEDSSVSSETTSYGQGDQKKPQRGIGRSTSGVGRPLGREHKRHVSKYGLTRLAEACETGELAQVKEWRDKDPEQLEIAEFAGNKPLQIAALNGNAEVVKYLIEEGCQVDCANVDKDTPLIDAAENGHAEVVRILLEAGVNPLKQNQKGQQALDVVSDKTDNATEIRAALRDAIETWNSMDAKQRREEEEDHKYRAGPSKEVFFLARTYENLLHLVTINDRSGVREFLDAHVPVDNTVIAAAAKTGDLYLMNMLLAEMTDKKRLQKPEKPMLSVLGTSHFEMVKSLTELDQFNPLWLNRQGKKWSEIAAEKAGPMWKQETELLRKLEAEAELKQDDRRSSSPIMRRSDAKLKHKRQSASRDEDDEDDSGDAEDETPRRKNNRRLVSRKDMRATSGRRRASGESASDAEESDDDSMRPPTVKEKRGPGRPRTKNIVAKQEEPSSSTIRRRKSSSARKSEENEPPKPPQATPATIEESVMDVDTQALADNKLDLPGNVDVSKDDSIVEQRRNSAQIKQQQEAELQQQLQLAAEQEQVQRELQRQQAAEELKQKQLDEERERQRQQELRALEAARLHTRQQVLQALPDSMSWLLNPDSDFSYDERGAHTTLLQCCEPLQALHLGDVVRKSSTSITGPLVLNLTIAPLLGKRKGMQILLPREALDEKEHNALQEDGLFPGILVADEARAHIEALFGFATPIRNVLEDEVMHNGIDDHFAHELAYCADLYCKRAAATDRLRNSPLVLRWLSLQHVVDNFHPAIRGQAIAVRHEWGTTLRHTLVGNIEKDTEGLDFFSEVCKGWEQAVLPHTTQQLNVLVQARRGKTTAQVVHGK